MPAHIRPLYAFAVLALFLSFAVADRLWLVIWLVLIAVFTLGFAVWSHIAWKRNSRYSLDALRELHETGGPAPMFEEGEVAEDAGVVCSCCGHVYGAWLLVCPHCKH